MKRRVITLSLPLALLASAGLSAAAHAQSAVIGGATMQRPPLQADPLGPRSTNFNASEALARSQIEQGGYSSVHRLARTGDGGWQALARNRSNATVTVALNRSGQVNEVR